MRTFCSICATAGMYRPPTVSPVSGAPSRIRPAAVNWSFHVITRGSKVTRSTPRSGMSVRSTAWATSAAPPVTAGLRRISASRSEVISKTASAGGGCRMRYPGPRVEFGSGRRNRRVVLGVDRSHDLPRDQQLRPLTRVNAVAAERRSEYVGGTGVRVARVADVREGEKLPRHPGERIERNIHAVGVRPASGGRFGLDDRVVPQ